MIDGLQLWNDEHLPLQRGVLTAVRIYAQRLLTLLVIGLVVLVTFLSAEIFSRLGTVSPNAVDFFVRHGYALLFFWILAEQCALPLPSVPLLLACGALARDGRMSIYLATFYGVSACLIADNAWFAIGRRRGAKVLRLICKVSLEPDSCVRQTETLFLRYGNRSLLVAKFVPGLNAVAAPISAMSGTSHIRFVAMDALGALLWIATYGGLGYIFRNQLDLVGDYLQQMGKWASGLVFGLLAAWIGWKYWQRRRFLRSLVVARITPQELRKMLDSGEEVVVVDVRSPLESEVDPVPGALRLPLEELEEGHVTIPPDRDIILFCS